MNSCGSCYHVFRFRKICSDNGFNERDAYVAYGALATKSLGELPEEDNELIRKVLQHALKCKYHDRIWFFGLMEYLGSGLDAGDAESMRKNVYEAFREYVSN